MIPVPQSVLAMAGSLQIDNNPVISYPAGDSAAKFAAQHLATLLQQTRHMALVLQTAQSGGPTAAITFVRTPSHATDGQDNDEAYELEVLPTGVIISASGNAGLYYGSVTLWQMLTAGSMSGPVQLGCLRIHDGPHFHWRGLMIDSARHMQSIAELHRLVDWMSLEKLNVLHWHLTDDQAWRLEIKRYPRLTQIGGWRTLPSPVPSATPGKPPHTVRYGGFYTQAQIRELVAYAKARNVMIVPEIEMPGHASAALAAYPQFGSSHQHLRAPVNEYGIFPNLYNVNDSTFTFLENVLTETMDLFPSPYIHIGGDEAVKTQWKASPVIQARMRQLGLKNEEELQGYFIQRISAFLTAHGRRTLGWDEILQGGLARDATIMSWRGVEGGVAAAQGGHDAVLTPPHPLYFDRVNGALAALIKIEPFTLPGQDAGNVLSLQSTREWPEQRPWPGIPRTVLKRPETSR